jgi:hypothetical protein
MRGSVRELDSRRVVIETDTGALRELPAAYVDEHLEHAYALTGHSMRGATVERAIVVASPRELTAGWSYTALSRARGETRVLIVDGHEDERSEFAPADCALSPEPLFVRPTRRMLERDDEDLAVEQLHDHEHPERSAERAEPRGSIRAHERLEDLNARVVALAAERRCMTQWLEELPAPATRRFRREHDPAAVEREFLRTALSTVERELEHTSKKRHDVARRIGFTGERGVELEAAARRVGLVRERFECASREHAQRDQARAREDDLDRGIEL